jgi:hypothetical protein
VQKPGKWFGNKHFSKTNSYLKANGEKEIDWILITVVFNSVGYFLHTGEQIFCF